MASGKVRHQRHEDQQDVGRQVGEDHRVDQPDARRPRPPASAETPARMLAPKKMAPSVAGSTPKRTWNQ